MGDIIKTTNKILTYRKFNYEHSPQVLKWEFSKNPSLDFLPQAWPYIFKIHVRRVNMWVCQFVGLSICRSVLELLAKRKTIHSWNLVHTLPWTISEHGFFCFFRKRDLEGRYPRKTAVSRGYLLDCIVFYFLAMPTLFSYYSPSKYSESSASYSALF